MSSPHQAVAHPPDERLPEQPRRRPLPARGAPKLSARERSGGVELNHRQRGQGGRHVAQLLSRESLVQIDHRRLCFVCNTAPIVARHLHSSVAEEAAVHEPSMPEAMSSADLVKELASSASLLIQRQVKLARIEAKSELEKGKT